MSSQFFNQGREKRVASISAASLEIQGAGKFEIGSIATIGRAPDSHVVVNLKSVSRNHARIFLEGGHYWIKDLDSANGTLVNGKKIKLQMLADRDEISFGEAKAIFYSSARASGPASVAQDPLAGSEKEVSDGTPTGGLGGEFPLQGGKTQVSRQDAIEGGREIQSLTRKVESLKAENEMLRREIAQHRAATATAFPTASSEKEEIERLRTLVGRLERALVDANLRIRNLQQRPDETKK